MLIGLAAAGGCTFKHNDAIGFVTNTQGGIRVGMDATQRPEVQMGYNRQEFALVPLYKAGMHDGLSANHPVVAGILRQAARSLEAAKGSFANGQLSNEGREALAVADQLIATAQAESAAKGEPADKQADQLLQTLRQRSQALITSQNSPQSNIERRINELLSLIEVEVQKPALIAEFKEHLKYVGEETGPERRKDAYSVFGSFRGRASGKAGEQVQAEGNIAQFFATGVAAQILAREGGAAAINTKAEAPGELRAQAEVLAIERQMADDLETVMTAVTDRPAGTVNRAQLDALLKDAQGNYLRQTQSWPDKFGGQPADLLRTHLVGEGNRHVAEMAARVP